MKQYNYISLIRIVKTLLPCLGLLFVSFTRSQAREVSVYLTSQRLGNGEIVHATSGQRKIPAASVYKYQLSGKVRGQSGKPISSIVKDGTDITKFVDYVFPGNSSSLSGTFSNPSGMLPATVITKKFSGMRNVKGLGNVTISFVIVGKILADGECVFDVTEVKIKSTAKQNLGSIIFSKGAKLSIITSP